MLSISIEKKESGTFRNSELGTITKRFLLFFACVFHIDSAASVVLSLHLVNRITVLYTGEAVFP